MLGRDEVERQTAEVIGFIIMRWAALENEICTAIGTLQSTALFRQRAAERRAIAELGISGPKAFERMAWPDLPDPDRTWKLRWRYFRRLYRAFDNDDPNAKRDLDRLSSRLPPLLKLRNDLAHCSVTISRDEDPEIVLGNQDWVARFRDANSRLPPEKFLGDTSRYWAKFPLRKLHRLSQLRAAATEITDALEELKRLMWQVPHEGEPVDVSHLACQSD